MNDLPYALPANGKIFYLLTDDEVESFNYFKVNGSKHGLDVSLKMAMTEFGRVLVVQVGKLKKLIEAVSDIFTPKPRSPEEFKKIPINAKSKIDKKELARKQGIPEQLINQYLASNNTISTSSLNKGIYKKVKPATKQIPPHSSLPLPLENSKVRLLKKIIYFFKNLIR